jgi:type I restriction enzyme S subunit
LEDCCTFHNGLWTGKKPPFETATVIRNTNFTADGTIDLSDVAVLEVEAKQLSKRRLLKGDIIIEKSGGGPKQPVGRVVLFDIDEGVYSFSNFTSVIRVKDQNQLDPRYLHRVLYWWYVDGRTEPLQRRSTGIRNLDFSAYQCLEVPIPPLEEQKRIVAVLDQAFAALDRARALAEANLADAEGLLEASLAATFENGNEGWVDCTVGDVITLQRGFDITKKDQRNGTIPVVSSGGVKSFHDEVKVAGPGVVVGRKGSIGSVHFVEEDFWPHDTTLFVKDFKGNDPRLVSYLMRGLRLTELDTGSANPSLNRNLVHPMKIRWPAGMDQNEIAQRLYAVEGQALSLASAYRDKTCELAALRQSMLQKAFAGELT